MKYDTFPENIVAQTKGLKGDENKNRKIKNSSEFCAVYVIPPIFHFTQSIGCSEMKKREGFAIRRLTPLMPC